jgi:hypothetical protein
MLTAEDKQTIKDMRNAWANTIRKCYNIRHNDYKYYGARGITVCSRWRESFQNFFDDMGLRPEGLTLERTDNEGNYEPSNCRWATRQEQTENRRTTATVEWQGKRMTVAAWERHFGWKAGVLKARLRRLGYTIEEAFTKPVKCGAKLEGKLYAPRKPVDMSKVPRGLGHKLTKFTAEEVLYIREQKRKGASYAALARSHATSPATIKSICLKLGAYKET